MRMLIHIALNCIENSSGKYFKLKLCKTNLNFFEHKTDRRISKKKKQPKKSYHTNSKNTRIMYSYIQYLHSI